MAKVSQPDRSGMMMVVSYTLLFIVNSLVITIAATLFPSAVVLGTHALSSLWAVFHSMGTLSLVNTFTIPFVRGYEAREKRMFTSREWMALYFVENAVMLWIISRFSQEMGLGISSIVAILVLALVLDTVQGTVMMAIEKMRVK